VTSISPDAALIAWIDGDKRTTFSVRDHEVVEGTRSIRTLIVDLALRDPADDELYDACASLGRAIAHQKGSPTLASGTIDHASEALDAVRAEWLAGARAAVCEGFSTTLVEMARTQGLKAWEFPHCTVPLGSDAIAIAAGHPADEREVLDAWAARAAKSAALLGVRRAVVSGPRAPRLSMTEALTVAGIEVVGDL
jgi:hypothetical protein